MTPLFAHAGHWLVQILYAAPIIVMVVLLLVGKLRERRHKSAEGDNEPQDRNDQSSA